MKISTDKLYRTCNKYQFFTNGDISQYYKLFERNKEGTSLQTLATIIWICSVGYTENEIFQILQKECDLK